MLSPRAVVGWTGRGGVERLADEPVHTDKGSEEEEDYSNISAHESQYSSFHSNIENFYMIGILGFENYKN